MKTNTPDILADMKPTDVMSVDKANQWVNRRKTPDISPDIPVIDANVENVRRKLADRAEMGLKKYGVTTERTDLTPLDWLHHAQQEAMDMCVYLERLIQDEQQRLWVSDLPVNELGARLEALGVAMQNPDSRIDHLVQLATQCGLTIRFDLVATHEQAIAS